MAPDRPVAPLDEAAAALDAARLEVYALGEWGPEPGRCGLICVGGRDTAATVKMYGGSPTRVCTLVDWPLGLGKPTVRQIEAVAAIKDGSNAVEVPAAGVHLHYRDFDGLRDDLLAIVAAVREVSAAAEVRLVLPTVERAPDPARTLELCGAIREAGADAVVLGTGRWAPAHEAGVAALRGAAGPLRVTAVAGGGGPPPTKLIDAGADAVGVQVW